jgi:hypothetical protein
MRYLLALILALPALAVLDGGDADAEVNWAHDLTDPRNATTASYTLYTGLASSSYDDSTVIPEDGTRSFAHTRTINGSNGDTVRIYYAMSATDSDGESGLSNEAFKDFDITDNLPPLAPTITITIALKFENFGDIQVAQVGVDQ